MYSMFILYLLFSLIMWCFLIKSAVSVTDLVLSPIRALIVLPVVILAIPLIIYEENKSKK